MRYLVLTLTSANTLDSVKDEINDITGSILTDIAPTYTSDGLVAMCIAVEDYEAISILDSDSITFSVSWDSETDTQDDWPTYNTDIYDESGNVTGTHQQPAGRFFGM